MFFLLSVFVSFLLGESNPSITYTYNGAQRTGYIVVDQEWRSTATADVDYASIGVNASGSSLSQVLVSPSGAIGSRLYLLDSTKSSYELFKLVGNVEFSYDVDMTDLPCGMNAALYTIEMNPKGLSNDAQLGTGYCDAQFLGMVNGQQVSGCAELDIWEANREATVFTTHPCTFTGQSTKGSGSCQSDGCGFNAYRYGARDFYGPGSSFTLDTTQKFTVVTQFIGNPLTEIKRHYVQGGKVIPNANPLVYNTANYDSITDAFCKTAGHNPDTNTNIAAMGTSLARGHVLSFSLWDSNDGMGWLDASEYGPCPGGTADSAATLEKNHPGAHVVWSNIKFGPISTN